MPDSISEKIITLRGSHATSLTRYRLIKRDGFRTSTGRAGTGVYFWADGKRYLDLASAWYDHCLQGYSREAENQCIIVVATLKANRAEILDFEDQRLRESLDDLREKRGIGPKEEARIQQLVDVFIRLYEISRRLMVRIVRMKVWFPKDNLPADYSLLILGWPLAYAVRDVSIIKEEGTFGHEHETVKP